MSEFIMQCTTDMNGIDCYVHTGVLIRCKDCKRWFAGSNNGIDHDNHGAECVVMKRRMMPNDFCSYAERREE